MDQSKRHLWSTAWVGDDIAIYRDTSLVDRIHAPDIERVILVYRAASDGSASGAGELMYTLVALPNEFVRFPAESGFAGRVLFERQGFWAHGPRVYCVSEQAPPAVGSAARQGPLARWFKRVPVSGVERLPRDSEIVSQLMQGPVERLQTWQRHRAPKRVGSSNSLPRPFASLPMRGLMPAMARQRA